MPTVVPADVYPLATKDHEPIPLDVIKPIAFYQIPSGSFVELPATTKLLIAEAIGGAAILAFGESAPTVSDGVAIPKASYIRQNKRVAIAIPDTASYKLHVVALQGATVVVMLQTIECWQAIDQAAMLNTRL